MPCDVNQYVLLWWQWCEGKIIPQNVHKIFTYLNTSSSDETLTGVIRNQKTSMIALNDNTECENKDKKTEALNSAFDFVLEDKPALSSGDF